MWAKAYRDDANRWSHISVTMGVVAAGLSAAAGYTGLTRTIGVFGAGTIALAAALVTAISSSLHPAAKSAGSSASSGDNSILADKARVFHLTRVDFDSIQTVLDEFTKLCAERDAIVKAAPIRRAPGRAIDPSARTPDDPQAPPS